MVYLWECSVGLDCVFHIFSQDLQNTDYSFGVINMKKELIGYSLMFVFIFSVAFLIIRLTYWDKRDYHYDYATTNEVRRLRQELKKLRQEMYPESEKPDNLFITYGEHLTMYDSEANAFTNYSTRLLEGEINSFGIRIKVDRKCLEKNLCVQKDSDIEVELEEDWERIYVPKEVLASAYTARCWDIPIELCDFHYHMTWVKIEMWDVDNTHNVHFELFDKSLWEEI